MPSLAAPTNKLHQYISMLDEDRGYTIANVEGSITWMEDFKRHFRKRMGAELVMIYRDTAKCVMEIGVYSGASVLAMADFFVGTSVYGD